MFQSIILLILGGEIVLTPNISDLNGFMRMICGVTMTSFGTARLARNPKCMIGMVMVVAGAMKVAEGYYQYCPVVAMMEEE